MSDIPGVTGALVRTQTAGSCNGCTRRPPYSPQDAVAVLKFRRQEVRLCPSCIASTNKLLTRLIQGQEV